MTFFNGEYSLKHWIGLILTQNVIPINVFFVWNEKKVKTLIETFKKQSICTTPVTIGSFKLEDTKVNIYCIAKFM